MVIFVCGVITGALVIEKQSGRRPMPGPGGTSFGMPGMRETVQFMSLVKQAGIDLTSDQSNSIVKIMQDSQTTNAAIRKTIAPVLKAEAERALQAVNLVLTPDQRPKLAERLKERAQNRSGRGGEGGGRRGGEGGGRRGGEGGGRSRNPEPRSNQRCRGRSARRFDQRSAWNQRPFHQPYSGRRQPPLHERALTAAGVYFPSDS